MSGCYHRDRGKGMTPRPVFPAALSCLCVMVLGSACGDPAPPAPAKAAIPEIAVAFTADPSSALLYDLLKQPALAKKLGVKLKIVELTFDDAHRAQTEQGKSGGSTYDLFLMDDPWVPEYAMNGYVANLAELGYRPDEGFVKNTLELGYWPPRSGPRLPGIGAQAPSSLYALPIIGDTQLFTYRKDLVVDAPQSWDDIRRIAQSQADPAAKRYVLAMRGVAGNPIVTEWFPYLYSFGGELFDEGWRPRWNGPEGLAALQLFLELKAHEPGDVANFDSSEQLACYLEGQCLTNIIWTGQLLAAEDPSQSHVPGKNGWAMTPAQVRHGSQIGNFMIAIASGSKDKAAALEVVKWLTGDEFQLAFAKQRGIPVRVAAFENPALGAQYPWLPVIRQALDGSVARPRTPDWAQVETMLGQHLHQAVVGAEEPQAALDAAAQEVAAFFEQKGYYRE